MKAAPAASTTPAKPGILSYQHLQGYMYAILITNKQEAGVELASPHGAFWFSLDYTTFTTGNVPGLVEDVPILKVGDAANSNFILALQGFGPLFGPAGSMGQMPANGPPFFTPEQIQPIIDWINAGCPK